MKMARARNLKPGFFLNEDLASLEPLARILFEALWCLADREGRLEDRPRRIKTEALPYDDCDVDRLLQLLHDAEFILRYEAAGTRYIEVLQFRKHQRPHLKEAASIIPAPDQGCREKVVSSREKVVSSTELAGGKTPSLLDPSLLDPSFLDPGSTGSTSIPYSPPLPGSGANTVQNASPGDKASINSGVEAPKVTTGAVKSGFLEFWTVYPKKRSKGQAERAWSKLKPDAALFASIMQGLERARASPDWHRDSGQYIPYPATWLNAKGWEDEHDQVGAGEGAEPWLTPNTRRAYEIVRKLEREEKGAK